MSDSSSSPSPSPSHSSPSSPTVLKRMKNIFENENGKSITVPSLILMKRKKNIDNNNIFKKSDNNMKDFNNIDTSTTSKDSVDIIPDDYYHRHRERKLEYQKNYNRENDDKIKEYNKDYYLKRRAEILEKAKTRITCECGCDVQLSNMNAHKKTKKHLNRVVKTDNN